MQKSGGNVAAPACHGEIGNGPHGIIGRFSSKNPSHPEGQLPGQAITGLAPEQFDELVSRVGERVTWESGRGRPRQLSLRQAVKAVVMYFRTNVPEELIAELLLVSRPSPAPSVRFSQRKSSPGVVEDEGSFGDGADAVGAEGDVLERAPAFFQLGRSPFAQCPRSAQERVAGMSVGVKPQVG